MGVYEIANGYNGGELESMGASKITDLEIVCTYG